jgi:hypothetical protein
MCTGRVGYDSTVSETELHQTVDEIDRSIMK